ncbi:hypothetical protein [Kitasatospora sp. NPDC047058]|uniref:hypothetical protein n=1 Tax=Kitasatospora sp. NPDC047058 TaxID=3155620 RepID=UPI0033E0DF65
MSTHITTNTGGRRAHPRAAYWAARSRDITYGRWNPDVPAGPARQHAEALAAAGRSWRQIADDSGLAYPVIRNLLVGASGRPPTKKLRAINAAAILSVPVPAQPDGTALIDTTGSRRRLQALHAAGWPLGRIARTAYPDRQASARRVLFNVLHGRTSTVTPRTAARIRAAYDALWDQFPDASGVPWAASADALRLAAANRWAPPLAWDDDDIDNPDALPDWTGRCGTPGGYYDHTVLGTPTCQPCRHAVAVAAADRKLRRRQRASTAA